MKKLKSILCIALLSIFLVGNVFAGDSAGSGIFSLFNNVVKAFTSMLGDGDGCPLRDCVQCKPNSDDGGDNCRPTEN